MLIVDSWDIELFLVSGQIMMEYGVIKSFFGVKNVVSVRECVSGSLQYDRKS